MKKRIDEIDTKIINLLLLNGDITNREISLQCKIALGTVNNRIKRLTKEGIIRQKTILVDYDKLGYNIEVLIDLKIKFGEFEVVAEELTRNSNVFLIINTTGDFDAEILCRFFSKNQLNSFIKKMQQNENINSTRTRLILNIFRDKHIK